MPSTGGYSAGSIFLQVVPSFAGFESAARKAARGLEDIFGQSADNAGEQIKNKIKDAFETGDAEKAAKKSGQKSGDAMGGAFQQSFEKYVNSAISKMGDGADAETNRIRQKLESLKGAKIGVDIDSTEAIRQIREVENAAHRLASLSPNIDIQSNALKTAAELKALQKEVGVIDGKKIKIKFDVDGTASAKLSTLDKLLGKTSSNAENTANSFRAFNGVILTAATIGPALIPILAAIAGGLLALGPAAAAAVAGVGGLVLAFSGIGTAIQALSAVQNNAAKDQDAAAKRIRNTSETVQNAQRQMKNTIQDVAQANEDAARRRSRAEASAAQANVDAAQRVSDAQKQAADAIQTALQRQEDAQKSLTKAQEDATKAQQDLRQARKDAQKDLDDIAARQRQNAVDERQAVIDLFNATVQNNAVQQDKGSTNLEREQAAINLEQAKIRLDDIRKTEKDLQTQRKQGVQGSQKVQTAEDNVKTAIERQAEAQKNLQQAVKDTQQARIDGAQQVQRAIQDQNRTEKDGIQSVGDAVREQQRTVVSGQRSIADAAERVRQTQEDLKQALYETGKLGSASMQALDQAMSVLGPDGQKFARFIFGLRDEFYQVRNAVQAGLFPGLTESIQTLVKTYLPDFIRFSGTLGKTFGDLAKLTANTLVGKTWKTFFSVFEKTSPKLIENYSKVFLNLATVVAQLLTLLSPFALEFSQVILNLSQDLVDFFTSAKGQKDFTDFMNELKKLGPPALEFFMALTPALFDITKALIPLGSLVLKGLTGILEWIDGLDPKVLQGLTATVITLFVAFQAANGAVAVIGGAIAAVGGPISIAVVAIVALIGVLVYLYTTNETARKIINAAIKAIGDTVKWYWDNILVPYWTLLAEIVTTTAKAIKYAWVTWIYPTLKVLGDFVSWLWRKILSPVFNALGAIVTEVFKDISWAWNNILWPVLKVISKIVWELWSLAFKVAFDAIGKGFGILADGMSYVWRKILYPILAAIGNALGIDLNGKSLKNGLVHAFTTAVGMIGTIWGKLKDLAKAPIKFILDTVLNHGLIDGFNWLAGKMGMDTVQYIPIPKGFARGGIDSSYGIRPGYTPGRDTHLIAVGGGEAILRPELTRALGSDWVYGANYAARTGGVRGAARFLGHFKNGGEVQGGSGVGIYDRTTYHGKAMDYYTVQLLQAAEKLVGRQLRVTQGSYSTSVAASGSTHAGGGALDIGVSDLNGSLRQAIVGAMRSVGFAAWLRNPSQGPWPYHVHAIAAGDPTASPSAKRQVQDYYNGGNGLGGRDDGPNIKKDPSLLERILGGAKGIAGGILDVIGDPLSWLKSKVEGPLKTMKDKFGDNWLTQGLSKIPDKFFGAMVDKIKGLFGGGQGGDFTGSTSGLQKMVQQMAQQQFGWEGSQWNALNWLVSHESSWNPNAQNPSSSAYGLFQFLDGTWKGYGKKTSDPAKQAEYGMRYIKDRYGSPEAAKSFWESHHWYANGGVVGEDGPAAVGSLPNNGTMMYDNGGYLPPGLTTVVNLTGKPEPVFTAGQFEGMRGGGNGMTYAPTFNASDLTAGDVMDDFRFEMRRLGRGGN